MLRRLNIILISHFIKWYPSFRVYLIIIICTIFIENKLSGQQEVFNLNKMIVVRPGIDSVITVAETIIPGTIVWRTTIDTLNISYQLQENKIIPSWHAGDSIHDSVFVHFTILPYPFHTPFNLQDSSQIRVVEGDIYYNPIRLSGQKDLFESSGLEYDGSLTRGFSLGNNQSLVFDSELNLQLGGNIGDGYEIRAAITDNNLPIQPDGTTRQIQEFDKVFIEIKKDQHSILAGDFDAIQPPGYFMRYNRKLKGAQYTYSGKLLNQPWSIKGSAAVSRGKFTRQTIVPAEGNQGPYPLRGENGELFIIVLAGSEKVFLDGRLLIRGEDADYFMDYNQSEITFTRNILINVRHRITIEFEYAQFNFQKSHNAFEIRYDKQKIQSYLNFFQENDSKSVTGDLELTPEDLSFLQMAGDANGEISKSGIRVAPEGYNSNSILYALKDTLVESELYQDVLVWSTDPQIAVLTANFSEVGQGQGEYIISPNPSPNGRVYEWIAPDPITGQLKGNFAPIVPLQAPQQKQMLTAGGRYAWKPGGVISGEAGFSRNDLNRYSSLDDEDNLGFGLKMNVENEFRLGRRWKFTPFGGIESTTNDFRPLDPYRNPEFVRDWNLPFLLEPSNEQLPHAGVRIGQHKDYFIQYKYDGLFREAQYNGNRHSIQMHVDTSGWKIDALLSALDARDASRTTNFFRPTLQIERLIRKEGGWRIGTIYFEDRNEIKNNQNDTLLTGSFVQNKYSAYIKNDPEANTFFQLTYNQERPRIAFDNELVLSESVSEWNLAGHLHQWKNLKLEYSVKHRDAEPLLGQANRSRNLLGRLDMRADVLKKAIKYSAGYEIGNGQEPKVEYKYIKVQKGEGIYIWVDDGDGIEELNEFEQAPFADQGEYIRLNVFNNDFIRTRALGLQQTINFDYKLLKATGLLSKIAFLSTYQLNRKIREDTDSPYWNPFYQEYADTAILGYNSSLRNILYWNRSSTRYDIQLGHLIQRNQVLQTSGYDNRELEDISMRWRISLQKKMDIILNVRKGRRETQSQFFENKNYHLSQFEAGPEVNIILKDKFRLTGSYQFLIQENISGNEKFESNKFSLESVWRQSSTTDLRTQISLVNISYASQGNLNVDFAILQGLQNGSNVLWTAQLNTRLNKSLVLTLQYNGRNTGEEKTVHTGTAQVRATF